MVIKLKNVHIAGGQTGISTEGPVQIEAENVTFDNVRTPWDLSTESSGTVRGSRVKNDPKMKSTVGWRRPKGPPLPAFCPLCKTVFSSRNYVFAGQYWQFWGNEEPCIKCGHEHALLSEGVFDLTRDAVRVLSAPDITHAMLQSLAEALKDAQSDTLTPDQTIRRAESIVPGIGAILVTGLSSTSFGNLIMALALIVAIWAALKAPTQPTPSPPVTFTQQSAMDITLRQLEAMREQPVIGPQADIHGQQGGEPPKKEAVPERGSPKILDDKKPHARTLRRKEMKARRSAFGGSRHCSPRRDCD